MTNNQNLSKALLLAAVALALGLLFNWLLFGKLPGISYSIFIAATLVSYFGLSSYFKIKRAKSSWVLAVAILVLAFFVAVRAGDFLSFLNIVIPFFLLLILAGSSGDRKLADFEILDYLKSIFVLPFQFVASIPTVVANLFVSREELRNRGKIYAIIRGLVITMPILVIFILLFSSADLVFDKFVGKIFDFDLPNFLPRFILTSFVTFAFIGAFGYLFQRVNNADVRTPGARAKLGLTEIRILFGAVNVLFLAFILVQITYLFGGEDNITKLGFTYADYARKGFFELIAVAVVSFALLLAVERHAPRAEEKHNSSFKILSSVLIVQVIAIMISSFKRLVLYENAYGFTDDRFYAHALTIGLGLIFLLLLYKIIADQKENRFMFGWFVVVISFLVALNLLNPDAFIAKKNIDKRLAENEPAKLDMVYLKTLSSDATGQILLLLDVSDKQVRSQAAQMLENIRVKSSNLPWQSFHFGRKKALSDISDNSVRIEQILNDQN